MSDDCTRENEFHMHSDRCYEAGRREGLADVEAVKAERDHWRATCVTWSEEYAKAWESGYAAARGLADIRDENLRVIKHEAETPMRGHGENGECCRRARLGDR